MDASRRRVGVRCNVVAGSVWESRMKSDEVGGGVKVFSGEQSAEEGGNGGPRLKRSQIGGVVATGKRKTWKSERSEGLENNQIQIARGKSEPQKRSSSSQQCKDLNISSDSIKKSPIQVRKLKPEGRNEIGASVAADKLERSPIHTRKKRSEVGESGERHVGQLKKNKSDSVKNVADRNGGNAIQLRKDKSELGHVLDESRNGIDGLAGGSGRIVIDNRKNDTNENCKHFGVCQEMVISSSSDNAGMVKCSPVPVDGDSGDVVYDDEEEEEGEEVEEDDEGFDIEMEKESFDVKEISVPESKVVNEPERKEVVNVPEKQKIVSEPEPKKVVSTNKQFHRKNERPVAVPITVKPSPPIRKHSTIHQNFSKADSIPKVEEYCSFPQNQNKLQSLVDLIMWRDISRSAFIFGIGTFAIVSSSYAKDINLSLISVMSYIGLVYLAVIFLYRSLICRGVIHVDTNYVLGEEEAIWVIKLILPYLNEFLSKLRAMFSGDPGTTMKLAVLLFVLARCGSSITMWKMTKFGFFGFSPCQKSAPHILHS
ncbi:Reticulon protein B21 [Spatholobus suberectus]|nr:Reticulon protein B21 [Spatholobus suberectus]